MPTDGFNGLFFLVIIFSMKQRLGVKYLTICNVAGFFNCFSQK